MFGLARIPGTTLRRRPHAHPHPRHRRDRPRGSGSRRLWRKRQLVLDDGRRDDHVDVDDVVLGNTVTVSETDYKLSPSPLTISKAGTYTIEAKNDGAVDHALTVEGNGLEETRTDTISPGQSATITVTLKPGTYRMYCPIGGHRALGMKGTITVNS